MHPLLTIAAAVAMTAAARAPAPEAPPSAPPAPAPAAEKGAEAPPGPPRLVVLPLAASSDLALLGRSLAEALAQEAAKLPGVEVVAPAAAVDRLGGDAAASVECGESASCLAGPAVRLGAERIVGGRLERLGANYRFSLVLVEAKGGTVLARAAREVPIASRRLRTDLVAAAGPLLRGEAAGAGTLRILTDQPGAEVRVDDAPAGRTPLEVKLASGKHRVEVLQRGKLKLDPFWVEVPAGGTLEQRVRLYDIPFTERKPGEVETVVEKVKLGGGRK